MTMNRDATKAALRSIAPAVVFAMLGCDLPSKTVGNESETDGDDTATDDGEDDGASSMDGPNVSVGSQDGGTLTDGSGDDGSNDDGAWDACGALACGEFCYPCNPDDPDCALPGTFTVCTPEGSCEPWSPDEDPCPGTGLQPGFEQSLGQHGGCGDMTVYASDEAATIALHLDAPGLVDELETAGMPIVRMLAADDPALSLEVTTGADLLAATCTDVLGDPPAVAERWRPAAAEGGDAGTITIELELVDDLPYATVTLTNVNLRRVEFDGIDPDIAVPSLVIPDIHVGWLPG